MKSRWKETGMVIAAVGALILIGAIGANAQGPPGPPPGGGGFRGGPGGPDGLGPLARDLNLTDDQKAQIKKITDSFVESTKALRDQLKSLHEDESNPFTETFDEAAVRTSAEARAKLEVELAVAQAKMMSQIAAVLTSDQKAQIAARRQQFGPKPMPQL